MDQLPRIAAADRIAHAANRFIEEAEPTRLEEARLIIEEYANDLRERAQATPALE
jgi:hypothetical protein